MIAVTGVTGWIGSAVAAWLHANGRLVRGLSRRPRGGNDRALELLDPEWQRTWPQALEGCTTVVHCAAHVHRPIENAAEQQAFGATNSVGTARLVEAAGLAGVRRFVLVSSIAIYDWNQSCEPRAESAPLHPDSAYGRSKLAAEQFVRESTLDWRIGRLATVYGAGDRANFYKLAQSLRRHHFVVPGRGTARKSVLPIGKAAELLGVMATADAPARTTLNLAAPHAPSLAEICDGFSAVGGFRQPPRVPLTLFRAAALAGDGLVGLGLRFPFTTAVARKLATDTVVDVSLMSSVFPNLGWGSFTDGLRGAADYFEPS